MYAQLCGVTTLMTGIRKNFDSRLKSHGMFSLFKEKKNHVLK